MNVKRFIAEFIGTFTLVLIGCGTAMLVGCDSKSGAGYLLTALAFGLALVAMAYSIGNVSGCHINPAVSLAFCLRGDISIKEMFFEYMAPQIFGALGASLLLKVIWHFGNLPDMTGAFGSNGLAGVNNSIVAGLIVETILTFIFVLVIMGVTSDTAAHGSFAGLIIGVSLTAVHIIGIGLTGTSVNPARSIGPAILALTTGNLAPIYSVWIFIVGPLVGATLAAGLYSFLESETQGKY